MANPPITSNMTLRQHGTTVPVLVATTVNIVSNPASSNKLVEIDGLSFGNTSTNAIAVDVLEFNAAGTPVNSATQVNTATVGGDVVAGTGWPIVTTVQLSPGQHQTIYDSMRKKRLVENRSLVIQMSATTGATVDITYTTKG